MLNKYAAKILVLDDDAFTLKLLKRILGQIGFTSVVTCDNGQAALQLLDTAGGTPELILLDLNMPEMDGVEFVHKLVERHYAGSIILVSGEDQRVVQTAQKMVQEHKIPLLGRLSKPVTAEALSAILDEWNGTGQSGSKIYASEDVRAAIADGELVNYYQPKVEPVSGRVMGVETLLRWNHAEDGLVLPDRFIGVAEAHGLIGDLTAFVLTDALAQAHAWKQAGLSLQLAVNISMNNLESPDFADAAAQLAADAGVPPQQVMLEVKETRMQQPELRVPLETLTRLRLKRFRLSLDNFGIGNSPLSRLRDIPFDELKVDRSIIHGICTDAAPRAKYDTTRISARQLGMECVAVGVDNADVWNLLRRTRCDFAQGYFIAHPMPASELPDWLGYWQARVDSGYQQ